MTITTCHRLIPELEPFMKTIREKHPVTGKSVAGILAHFNKSWQRAIDENIPYQNSVLTPSGYPIEFNFRSDDESVCYTAEPGLPTDPVESKLDFLQLSIPDFPDYHNDMSAAFIQQPNQRFGCWISMRHHESEFGYKLYHEVTQATEQLFINSLYADIPSLPASMRIKPMLIGTLPNFNGISEYYCKLTHCDNRTLHQVFLAAGVSKQLPFIISLLSWLASKQPSSLFQNLAVGISYKVAPNKLPSLTLFVHCPQIFATNKQARKQILSLAEQIGGKLELYKSITESLDDNEPSYPVHSILSIKLKSETEISCGIGLSPWL